MNKFIETIKHIWAIEDLRKRILLTLGLLAIYRFGSYVVLPGINPSHLATQGAAQGGLFGVFDLFAGGAFSRSSVFALGIMPYISTSIVMQLLTLAVPYFQKLQKEGESGRKTINQWTRMGTIGVTLVQATAYVKYLTSPQLAGSIYPGISMGLFWFTTVASLTAGTIFVMWLGEHIQERGIGNGTSIIIMANIISRLPGAFLVEVQSRFHSTGGGILMFLLEMAFLAAVVMFTIMVIKGIRKVPLSYAKQLAGGGNVQAGSRRGFLPLKVNIAGVMPIIFAQTFLLIPTTVAQLFPQNSMSNFLSKMTDHTSLPYNIITFLMVVLFTYFYTALIMNPTQMADELKRSNGYIPGIKPGASTAEYIDTVLSRITLPGSIFLGLIAIMPVFASSLGVNSQFSYFFGGTSLLILVSVVLDTMDRIETFLLNRHYDGLTKSGSKLKGRIYSDSNF
jgi:preprotein translocase subunit SecY